MRVKNSTKRKGAFLLLVTFVLTMCITAVPVFAQEVEQNIFEPLLNGDVQNLGNIELKSTITSGEVYFEAKIKLTGTDHVVDLFKIRNRLSSGGYSVSTPTIAKFQNGKLYARDGWTEKEVPNATYKADTWYIVKVKVTMVNKWGYPVFSVWFGEEGAELKQYVYDYVVTGGLEFTTLGRIDFSAGASTPFEYVKGYRLVDASAPSVFMNTPTSNQDFIFGEDTVTLSAEASYTDGIEKVEFYEGTTKIGEATTAPYSYIWADAPVGSHSVTAKAYAVGGGTADSSAVTFTVSAPNVRPVVNITSPLDHHLMGVGQTVPIIVEATDPDGEIVSVDFYCGTTKLETVTKPIDGTYSGTFAPLEPGTYVVTAIATDDRGGIMGGQSLQIEVGDAPLGEDIFYQYAFDDYTGTGKPSGLNVDLTGGSASAVPAPNKPEWGNCVKLDNKFSVSIHMPTPNPNSGIIVAEGDFMFEGFGNRRTLFHPRYTSSAAHIAQILSTEGNKFITKDGSFTERDTSMRIKENEWYHIKTIVDLDNHTYAVEINGQTVARMAQISYGQAFNAINMFNIQQKEDGCTDTLYIDNLKVSRRAEASVTTSISQPYSGKTVQAGKDVTFKSIANTPEGTVSKVEYYNGDTLLYTATASPYTFVWENIPAGTHSITAKSYSTTGITGTSNPVVINAERYVIPSVFGSGMILQQNMPIRVFGSGLDGEVFSVEFNGETKQTTAVNGEWMVEFDPLAADNKTTYTMKITAGGDVIEYSNIMMGEVWLCGGQSNMEFTMYSDADKDTEVANANYPNLRLFTQSPNPIPEEDPDVRDGKWSVCSAGTVSAFSAVGYYFGRDLHKELDVPVGMICAAVGGTPMAAWLTDKALESREVLATYKNNSENNTGNTMQNGLYNGMVAPLVPFGMKGVIWYQGEADRWYDVPVYENLLGAMIDSYREVWGNDDLAFHFVQLPNYSEQVGAKWPAVRDGQFKAAQTNDNVGVVVTLDVGDSYNLHPTKKQPVGQRLALSALKLTYGKDIDVYTGPVYKNMEKDGGKLIVDFYHKGSGLTTNNSAAPACFEISGADGVFYPATAVIENNKITVSSTNVSDPTAVRYAYSNDPRVNLFNAEGFPAAPFNEVYTPYEEGVVVHTDGIVYKDAQGGVTGAPSAGGSAEVTVTVTNNTPELAEAVAVLYLNQNGRLISVRTEEITRVTAGGRRTVTLSLPLPNSTGGLTAEALVWDSLAQMHPLTAVIN